MNLEKLLEENEVIIEVNSPKDKEGRQTITSYWRSNNVGYSCNEVGNRAQVSLCKLDDKVRYWEERGKQVSIINPNNYLV